MIDLKSYIYWSKTLETLLKKQLSWDRLGSDLVALSKKSLLIEAFSKKAHQNPEKHTNFSLIWALNL